MQSYTHIQSTASLQSSLAMLLNNDRTSLSNSSGSAFPTVNIELGMLCYRSDLRQLFILLSTSPVTWAMVLDLSAPTEAGEAPVAQAAQIAYQALSRALSGDNGAAILLEKPESGTTMAGNMSLRLKGNRVEIYDTGGQTRGFFLDITQAAEEVGSRIWHSGNDGAESGLDADLLDGRHAGNANGSIPINNGTLNTNLNADLLDGKQADAFALLESPALSGTPTAPTAAVGRNTTQIATTAFVQQALATVNLGSRVAKTGDTMTGNLTISSGAVYLRGYGGNTNRGIVFLNAANSRYLDFNGSTYQMPGAELYVNGGRVWTSANVGTPMTAADIDAKLAGKTGGAIGSYTLHATNGSGSINTGQMAIGATLAGSALRRSSWMQTAYGFTGSWRCVGGVETSISQSDGVTYRYHVNLMLRYA